MAINLFHPEEESTVGLLLAYCKTHPKTHFTVSYDTGEEYLCKFYTSYEADNENAVDDGTEAELVEYYAIAVDPVKEIASGPHHNEPNSLIEISYRDFPSRIVGEDGTVIYDK